MLLMMGSVPVVASDSSVLTAARPMTAPAPASARATAKARAAAHSDGGVDVVEPGLGGAQTLAQGIKSVQNMFYFPSSTSSGT